MVTCHACKSLYVEWLNYDEVVTKEDIEKMYPNNTFECYSKDVTEGCLSGLRNSIANREDLKSPEGSNPSPSEVCMKK